MKTRIVAAALLACVATAAPAQHHHWSYSGEGAPAHWGKLDPKYAACSSGKNQSPIDLAKFTKGKLQPVKLDYGKGAREIVNNGHTIQINYRPGSSASVDRVGFELKQFHFHAPSENTVNGKHFPLEAHLVHADRDGNLVVVAVLFSEGPANAFIAELWKALPGKPGEKKPLPDLDVSKLLPAELDYYQFTGSLTTPPCSEGVRWLVLKQPLSASKAQVAAFAKAVGFANNRPVQPLNARQIIVR